MPARFSPLALALLLALPAQAEQQDSPPGSAAAAETPSEDAAPARPALPERSVSEAQGMAHYLRHLGTYNPVGFGIGTALTFAKEELRLVAVEHTLKGTGALTRGFREARRIRRSRWSPVGTAELSSAS